MRFGFHRDVVSKILSGTEPNSTKHSGRDGRRSSAEITAWSCSSRSFRIRSWSCVPGRSVTTCRSARDEDRSSCASHSPYSTAWSECGAKPVGTRVR